MSEPTNDPKLAAAEAKAAKARAKALRPWFKKKRFIAPIALLLIIGVGVSAGGGSKAPASNDSNNSATVEPTEEAPTETVAQQNAREKAQSYLDISAFSRKGLIKQLVFEKFEKADAEYGVDALKIDWKEQAAKKAQEYLDIQSFSKGALIDQLVFEGFSKDEAAYGVKQAGL